ncbi:polysaccharide biosynthesis tyrosine autokinase [Croceicoccus sp. Ery5]|uniref:GumC family protein n=1 Tax=Croceicoccus sp. Ery5 TaxID=1703340 RepID=UPI001E621098|nr:polysaccharide biosynthesis tyrosine autokinase [Croceicoccus sp. Ery5]
MNQEASILDRDRFADDDVVQSDARAHAHRLGHLSQGDLDLREIRAALYRNRWLIGGVTAVAIIIGLLMALLSTPIYRSTATLQIDQQGPQILGSEDQDPTASGDIEVYLQTQVEVLRSRSLSDRVARSLNYYQDPSFFEAMEMTPPDTSPGSAAWQRAVINILQENLTIELTSGTRLVDLSFDSPSPQLSARVSNAFAEEFIASTLQRRFDMSAYSRQFLQEQLGQTRERLEESERSLIEYARQTGITNLDGGEDAEGNGQTLTGSNLATLNTAYATAQTDRILAEQKWRQAQATPLMSLAEVLSNPAIQTLQSQKAQAKAQLEGERDRHSADYPTVRQLEAQIAAFDEQIRLQATQVRNSIRDQYRIAVQQERSLMANVRELQGAALGEQSRGVQLTILRREADTNRALYDALLQRFRELNAAAGITANNILIIDRAETPSAPIWPRPLINAFLGAVIGFGLAAAIAFARERLDDSIRSSDDVERKLGLPVLGITPRPANADAETEMLDPHSPMSESIYALRTALELSTRDGLPQTLLVTSTRPAEGKSTTSEALAREFAQSGRRTVLVDADMRRPSVHHNFHIDNKSGFSTLLTSPALVPEALKTTDVDNLSVIPSGPIPPSPPRLLSGETLDRVFSQLRDRFDIIIIDAPPVLGLADAPQLASAAGGVLYVVEAHSGSQGQAKASIRRLLSAGTNILGVVLTKYDFTSGGYSSYGYHEYYSYGGHDRAEA